MASLHHPIVALLLIMGLASVFWHMRLGLQVVIEDYLHSHLTKFTALALNIAFATSLYKNDRLFNGADRLNPGLFWIFPDQIFSQLSNLEIYRIGLVRATKRLQASGLSSQALQQLHFVNKSVGVYSDKCFHGL